MKIDTQYEDLLKDVLENGSKKEDRTGVGTISKFGGQMRFDLSEGFPLITTKKVFMRGVAEELFWFLNGDTNAKTLQEKKVHIWDEWRRPYNFDREIVLVDEKVEDISGWERPEWSREEFEEMTDEDGETYNSLNEIEKALFLEWRHMMGRCYYSEGKSEGYAEERAVVKEWHDHRNFLRDAKELPHYWYWEDSHENIFRGVYHLDTDYYGSNYYSPETTAWIDPLESYKYGAMVTRYEAGSDEGERVYVNGEFIIKASDPIGRSEVYIDERTAAYDLLGVHTRELKEESVEADGVEYKIEKVYPPEGRLFRLKLIEEGELGPVYGAQWRAWEDKDGNFHDQIEGVMKSLREDPDSRRHIVNAWNVGDLENMALPPCHMFFQFYVNDGKLSLQMYARSQDLLLGTPFNLASYALLLHMMAQQLDLEVGEFIWTGGDLHIYSNHIEPVREQLSREPYLFPTLKLRKAEDLYSYTWDDVEIEGYQHHPAIKLEIAV